MANDKSKAPPEGRFAEAMRKSKEKRAGMKEQSEKRALAEQESLQREEAKPVDHPLPNAKDSENEN